MISSRWPRPIGISASIALRPVAIGSCTDLRGMMPGALTSATRRSAASIAPLPSIGSPSASTTRPSRPLPTGTSTIERVRLTMSPSPMSRSEPKITTPTLSASRFSVMPRMPPGNSTISPAWTLSRPWTRAMPSPTESTRPDFRDLGLLAEVLDLLLEDRGDFSGLDRHQPTSFMTFCSWASLERIEVSIIREPTLTTRPPIRLSSTVTSSLHVLADARLERRRERLGLGLGQRLGRGHLGGDLAALGGDQRLHLGERRRHDEEPAVLRHQPERVGERRVRAPSSSRSRRSPGPGPRG